MEPVKGVWEVFTKINWNKYDGYKPVIDPQKIGSIVYLHGYATIIVFMNSIQRFDIHG